MPWLLASSGHQQIWYQLCAMGIFLSSLGGISTICSTSMPKNLMWNANIFSCFFLFVCLFIQKNSALLARINLDPPISFPIKSNFLNHYWKWLIQDSKYWSFKSIANMEVKLIKWNQPNRQSISTFVHFRLVYFRWVSNGVLVGINGPCHCGHWPTVKPLI